MNQMKRLAEQIRQRQQEAGVTEQSVSPIVGATESESLIGESPVIRQIRDCGQGESLPQMVHIRLSGKDYRKLITLGAAKISAQKLTLYAIRQLLEQDEIKQLLKTLIDDLD